MYGCAERSPSFPSAITLIVRGFRMNMLPFRLGRLLPVALMLFALSFAAGCDSQQDDDRCEVFGTCDNPNQLSVSLIESRTRMPANVSVLFKVDTEDSSPIANLEPGSFDIYENDRLISSFESQQNVLPKTGQFRYSIVLLLDMSGSIVASENLEALKEAAQSFVESVMFEAEDARFGEIEMSIYWFDGQSDIQSLVSFEPDPEMLVTGIEEVNESITVDNSTNLYGAIIQGMDVIETRLNSVLNQSIITAGSVVLFTDGTDQANRESRSAALRAVDDAEGDLSIYSIGLGGEIDPETLTEVGKDGFVSASNITDLVPRFREIANLIRDEANSYYLLEYCSPKRDGENELTIKVNAGEYVGILSTKFSARNFSSGCTVEETL